MKTTGKPRGNITGQAFGKTRQTIRRNGDGMNRRSPHKNELAETEFRQQVDKGWRKSFLDRFNTLPAVPTTYIIPYTGNLDDLRGLSPL